MPTVQTQGLKICNKNEDGVFPELLPTLMAQDYRRRGPNSEQQGLPKWLTRDVANSQRAEATKYSKLTPNSQMGKGYTVSRTVCCQHRKYRTGNVTRTGENLI
ncbi:MAG: hypothetical protein ACLTZT_00085 [Butyricimonas faecalis]